jgi:hypothetical protein
MAGSERCRGEAVAFALSEHSLAKITLTPSSHQPPRLV